MSRRAGIVGTPERPLSDLGLRSYLAYWISALIRFFRFGDLCYKLNCVDIFLRRVLSVLSPDIVSITNKNMFPGLGDEYSGEVERISLKKRKKSKGFDGEVNDAIVNVEASLCMMPLEDVPSAALVIPCSLV